MTLAPLLPPDPRILVVDDSVVVRRVLVMVLRQFAEFLYSTIDEAANGALALKRLETEGYDLILSDIRMPGVDGLELVRRVRQEMKDTKTTIVLISTLGSDEDVRRGLDAGASAYVRKPIVPNQIRTALEAILAGRRGFLG